LCIEILRERFPKTEAEIGRDLVIPHAKDTRPPFSTANSTGQIVAGA